MTSITVNTKQYSTQQCQPNVTVHVKEDGHMTETKRFANEETNKLYISIMDRLARARFGANVNHWRAIAEGLEAMSEDVRQKRFDKLLGTAECIRDVWERYERTYNGIGPIWMAYFAPRAFTPDEFVQACAHEEIRTVMKPIKCPCCHGGKFRDNDAFPPYVVENDHLLVSLFCEDCGFLLDVVVNFES